MNCETCDVLRDFPNDPPCWKGMTWDVYWDEESYSSTTIGHSDDRPSVIEESAVLLGTFEAECWADMKVKSEEFVDKVRLRSVNGDAPVL